MILADGNALVRVLEYSTPVVIHIEVIRCRENRDHRRKLLCRGLTKHDIAAIHSAHETDLGDYTHPASWASCPRITPSSSLRSRNFMTASYLHESDQTRSEEIGGATKTRARREIIRTAPCGIMPPHLTRRYRGRVLGRLGLMTKVWDWVSPQ